MIVGCIYGPPDTDINSFYDGLKIKYIYKYKICYILGDFNINLFKDGNHSPTEEFF